MRGHPRFGAMPNGPHQQVDALQTPKSALDFRQTLVTAHRVFRRETLDGFAGAQHINPIELRFLVDSSLPTAPLEAALADAAVEVLAHLVAAQHFPHPQSNLRR